MAGQTKNPDLLRELFSALNNDPFVVAECLAKPAVAERMVTQLAKQAGVEAFVSNAYVGDYSLTPKTIASTTYTYNLPEIPIDCTDDSWSATSTVNPPSARVTYTVIWTGSEMIVWGGLNPNGRLNTGGRYNPATDSWTATSIDNAPSPRNYHSAVWTGAEMIVWGGEPILNTGCRYNPITDSWVTVSIANAPVPRAAHSALWTGSEMIVWGGRDSTTWYNSGGRYNPSTNSWTATSTLAAPERRWAHTAVWTGTEMIVWGGTNQTIFPITGGRYSPTTDSWTATNTANAPLGRVGQSAIWTGSEMVVWGGIDTNGDNYDSGGKYDPAFDRWIATSTNNAPSPRDSHTAVWTGTDMIVWGGVCCNPAVDLSTGGRYNPSKDSWIATGTANVPQARDSHSAVWTGDKMIVWGGGYYSGSGFIYLNTGGSYCAQPSTQLQSIVSRKSNFAGDFDLNLPLSGMPAVECRSGGATNDYTIVLTFNANISVTGNPQAAVTSGMGTIGSSGASNGGLVTVEGNFVTIPLTNVANAQTIQVTLYGLYGSTNLVIPMSILIGDTNGNGTVNASDLSQTKSRIGQQINATNFRSDVSANGYIDAADVALIKQNSGTSLPP
jgi:N-acetylneuraminic acid mutarotase